MNGETNETVKVAGAAETVATIDESARIAELEAQLEEKDAEIEALKPTKDPTPFLYETPEDVVAFHGEAAIDAMVIESLAAENRDLRRRGYPNVKDWADYTAKEKQKARDEKIASLLRDRELATPPVEGWLSRSLKMIKPDGSLIQIPYEVQVNNVAGSLADGYVRYERKKYKRTFPMLCPSTDCYLPAAEAGGKWTFGGYCSEDHFNRTERGAPIPA